MSPSSPEAGQHPTPAASYPISMGAEWGQSPEKEDVGETSQNPDPDPTPAHPHVVVVSVDGLSVSSLRRLGPRRLPNFWLLLRRGAGTLNARTEVEQTVTLSNHAGMMTGRRIDAEHGGHGWNRDIDTGARILTPEGEPVPSVFDVVEAAGGTTALLASKSKFAVYRRTWPSIDSYVFDADEAQLTRRAVRALQRRPPDLLFLHLSAADISGHAHGWGTRPYLRAVERVDDRLAEVLAAIGGSAQLSAATTLVLTADHGGQGQGHSNPHVRADYTVPFVVYGPGIAAGSNLYDLNPGRLDPGNDRPGYGRRQPVRNADVANLVTALLGLGTVPGSRIGVADPLTLTD